MFDKELKIALEAAKLAGAVISKYYGRNVEVKHKSAEQPITIADREANDVIRKTLLDAFPDDGWLSEETVDNADRLAKERVWIVDPLDGTKEFIAQIPEFGVSIALVVRGEPVVGVVFNPVSHELFAGCKGAGVTLNRKSVRLSEQKDLKKAIVLASRSETKRGEWKRFENDCVVRESGGIAYKMAQVASGQADGSFSLSPKNEWDIAAGVLLVQEAGGVVTLPDGGPLVFNRQNPRLPGIIYTNPFLYPQIRKLLSASQ